VEVSKRRAAQEVRALVRGDRYHAYAKRFDGPMLVLAVLFLADWSVDALVTNLPNGVTTVLEIVRAVIWVAFAVDLVIRVVISKHSWRFIYRHPFDVLPVLDPRLRPLKILTIFLSGNKLVTSKGVLATGQAVGVSVLLLMWIGAVALFDAENGAVGTEVHSFGDAAWWALVTITTVGYGDIAPVTGEGRVVASGLMLVGVAVFGVATASVAAWFVRLTSATSEKKEAESAARNASELKKLRHKVSSLEEKLDVLVERSEPGK